MTGVPGAQLKAERKDGDFTQDEVASVMDVVQKTVARIEAAKLVRPRHVAAYRAALATLRRMRHADTLLAEAIPELIPPKQSVESIATRMRAVASEINNLRGSRSSGARVDELRAELLSLVRTGVHLGEGNRDAFDFFTQELADEMVADSEIAPTNATEKPQRKPATGSAKG